MRRSIHSQEAIMRELDRMGIRKYDHSSIDPLSFRRDILARTGIAFPDYMCATAHPMSAKFGRQRSKNL